MTIAALTNLETNLEANATTVPHPGGLLNNLATASCFTPHLATSEQCEKTCVQVTRNRGLFE
jgi:hypothetical protein